MGDGRTEVRPYVLLRFERPGIPVYGVGAEASP